MKRLIPISIIIVLSVMVVCFAGESVANILLDDFTGPHISGGLIRWRCDCESARSETSKRGARLLGCGCWRG